MMRHSISILVLITALLGGIFLIPLTQDSCQSVNEDEDTAWTVQLNEMNYLIMKTSSINLIRGIHFNREQAEKLQALSLEIEKTLKPIPDTRGQCYDELKEVRALYLELIDKLIRQDSIGEYFTARVYAAREKESALIRLSVIGAQINKGKSCLKCHCEPGKFPTGAAAATDPPPVTPAVRKETDLEHIKGVLGEEATLLLWDIKEEVWGILSEGQRCVLKDFRCCLITSNNLQEQQRIGQAGLISEWQRYLDDIRAQDDKVWESYKPLWLDPIRDIIRSTLPGVRKREVESRIQEVEKIINTARKLDKMDYQIQKENLYGALSQAISIDQLNGESSRSEEDRQFITAMFLLYYGSPALYDEIIKQVPDE